MKARVLVTAGIAALVLWAVFAQTALGPGGAAAKVFEGTFGSGRRFSGLLDEITPLLLVGAAVFLALKAGLFNIGAEGQFLLGGLAGTAVGLKVGGPMGVVLGLLAGVLAGALWALPAGLIRAYRNGHEVITTIMLNSVAVLLTGYLIQGPLRDPESADPSTRDLPLRTQLPDLTFGKVEIPLGLFLGIAVVAFLAWWLSRTVKGYELLAVGGNAEAARFAGIDPAAVRWRAMATSGAIAGLAGAVQSFGNVHAVSDGFSGGYGFNALGVALLAGPTAWGVLLSGSLFGLLAKGGLSLSTNGVSKGITFFVLGLVILVAATVRYRRLPEVA